MSYSVSARGATQEAVKAAITAELEKVPGAQPVHEADINQAIATAGAFIGVMKDDPARDISIRVSGSIWTKDDAVQQVSVNVQVDRVDRA